MVFDEAAIHYSIDEKAVSSVQWDELVEVTVETTDQGPGAEDVYWVLRTKDGVCRIPAGASGAEELLERVQKLPGFENDAVIRAMGSTENATFLCWRRCESRTG